MAELYSLDGVAPDIHPTAFVAPGAKLIGRVTLGPQASVWFNAVLRGDNEPIVVGARSNVQDGCVLHTDIGHPLTIGADCTLGHLAIVHGCQIGDGCLIGMGATVMNGASIGAGSLVGASALVTEGKRFEPGSMILGAPAKGAAPLDPSASARLKRAAEAYVAKIARYRDGLSAPPS